MYKTPANTLFLGKNLIFVPHCHSTNLLALELSQKNDASEGSIVITNDQKSGRGQRGNTWISEPGKNFTFSIILKPTFLQIKEQFLLNMMVSLGIAAYVKSVAQKNVTIKWPNDIMVSGKKICGILIENQIQGTSFSSSVVGIGLNMNQQEFISPSATSMTLIMGSKFDLSEELEKLLIHIETYYLLLKNNRFDQLRENYFSSLHWMEETRTFSSAEKLFEGKIKGVDESGRLLVETQNQVKSFQMKELKYIR